MSEHAMPGWITSTALSDLLGCDLSKINDDKLYLKLDRLYPERVRIETELGEQERNLFSLDETVFFYDLTSTYFEGLMLGNPNAQRGYSRDGRPDCKQVVSCILSWSEKEAAKRTAEELDGGYLLKTDRKDLSGEEMWHTYIMLTRAESAFRDMKSPLSERPIFHQLSHRAETHIFLCVLAYHLLVAIEHTLRSRGDHRAWETIRELMKTHQIVTVVLPTTSGEELRIRRATKAEAHHREVYEKLNMKHEPMKPVKSWHPAGGGSHSDEY